MIAEVIRNLNLEIDSILRESSDDGRFITIEGINIENNSEEKYLIYDCSEKDSDFDFEKYKNKMENEEGISNPIIIFRTWDHEQEEKQRVYNSLKKASEKKLLLEFFEKKVTYYSNITDDIKLEVDDTGLNYLQYNRDVEGKADDKKYINSRVYNVSLSELKKVFNVTGKKLFKKNVREGLANNRTGKEIKKKFKEYVKVGAYYEIKKCQPELANDENVKALFGVNENVALTKPEYFWFYHNGITVFYYGKESIDYSGSYIRVNPRNLSVINGAQTITNYYEGLLELPIEFRISCAEFIEDEGTQTKVNSVFEQYLEEVSNKIVVKTIIIDGNEAFVRPVTYGLNTQIPIFEEDIVVNSDEVEEINKCLKKINMTITKSGQTAPGGESVTLLSFVKNYVLTKRTPGESKNLNKAKLKNLVEEIRKAFKENETELLNAFKQISCIEEFWNQNKKDIYNTYIKKEEKLFCSNGKNYFISFLLEEKLPNELIFDDDRLWGMLDKYINTFIELEPNPEIKTFKNDTLFEKYLDERERMVGAEQAIKNAEDTFEIIEDDCKGLVEYLNTENTSNYTVRKKIMDYLKQIKKDIPYFRVISRVNGIIKESFPFPNHTFNELYHSYEMDPAFICFKDSSFDTSEFAKEVNGKRSIFLIEWKETDGKREAIKAKYIPAFSFEKYNEEAKTVYNMTLKAFEEGDESMFPKISNNLKFHVRPKAANSSDTFDFTNGKQITKRTFWANKETIEELLGAISQ